MVEFLTRARAQGASLFLSSVVEAEVLAFSRWTADERMTTEAFLEENFAAIPFDRAIARIAADLRRRVKVKFPDAAIAATTLYTRTPLVTRNVRDFKHVPGLQIMTV